MSNPRVDPLIVSLAEGEHGYVNLRVGANGHLDPETMVKALASITPRPLELTTEFPNGSTVLAPGDALPGVAEIVSRVLRILGWTQDAWRDTELIALAERVDQVVSGA